MDNVLESGAVLPSGLLSQHGVENAIQAFNRSYRNTGLKAGLVTKSYAYNDPYNQNGLCTEYDVITFEQFENKGSTSIVYKNCLSTQGFGSLADYLEFTLRPKTFQTNKGAPVFSNQDGAIVLIQCLDGVGDKAIVTGYLIHPDRQTNITSNAPQLAGEYNGVNVVVNNDGSCALTFKGATDSKGIPTNPSQGNTVIQIQTDGTFQITNSSVTITGAKSGDLTINTTADANVTIGGNTNITTTGTANIIAQGTTTLDGSTVLLGQGATESVIKGDIFKEIFNNHTHLGNLGIPTGVPLTPLDPSLSTHVFTK